MQAKNRTTLLLQALPEGKIRLYAPKGYSLREADRLMEKGLRVRLEPSRPNDIRCDHIYTFDQDGLKEAGKDA